ncbi:MAG: SAM-dependent chlorinase/fluorinase [Thiobacillus sp.]
MILLFTDFGTRDPYVGQMKARLATDAPGQIIVDLLHESPDYNAHAGAHLLAALATGYPPGSVFVAVVDPGVGTTRDGVVVFAGGHWFVGPDNGLMSVVVARNTDSKIWKITWQPPDLSATFHGRDVFAPIAAAIARGEFPHDKLAAQTALAVEFDAGDLLRVIYLDHFGNVWTGIRAVEPGTRIAAGGHDFRHSESFGFVGKGEGFWFVNSVGLLELAVNRGSAAETFGLKLGDRVVMQRLN